MNFTRKELEYWIISNILQERKRRTIWNSKKPKLSLPNCLCKGRPEDQYRPQMMIFPWPGNKEIVQTTYNYTNNVWYWPGTWPRWASAPPRTRRWRRTTTQCWTSRSWPGQRSTTDQHLVNKYHFENMFKKLIDI